MTQKLFYENSYITESDSRIVDMFEKDGKILLVLDRTPFYPEGGGQPSDMGTIGEANVIHVFEDKDVIYHEVDKRPEAQNVKCVVDFARRLDHMQQHSGEHLLSAAFFRLYKGVNCGFHMGEDYVTIDINLKEVTEEMINRIEQEVNEYIFRNAEVYTYVVSRNECDRLPMRKEVKVEENIRIVQMGDIDYSACCGTHVVRTGEVGIVKIIRFEKYKGMTRVYFKCGKRALADYINKHNIVMGLGRTLSADENSIPGKVEAMSTSVKELNRRLADMKKTLAQYDAKELINSAASSLIVKNFEEKTFEDIQYVAAVLENEPYVVILSSLEDKRVLMSQNGDFEVSCSKLFKETLPGYGGKGGGNDKRAQASFPNANSTLDFVEALTKHVEKGKE